MRSIPSRCACASGSVRYTFRSSSEAAKPRFERHTTKERRGLAADTLDLGFFATDAMRFVEVDFRRVDAAICESDSSNTLLLPPREIEVWPRLVAAQPQIACRNYWGFPRSHRTARLGLPPY